MLEYAGLDIGVPDGAQVDRITYGQLLHDRIRERLTGAEIALRADVIGDRLVLDVVLVRGDGEDLEALGNNFGADSITRQKSDLVHCVAPCCGGCAC